MKGLRDHALAFATVAIGTAAADVWTKTVAFSEIGPGERVSVIPGALEIARATNEGVAFGLGASNSGLWAAVSLVAVLGVVAGFLSITTHRWILTLGMGLLLGGAAGNGFDRFVTGAVRDLISLSWTASGGGVSTLTFNLADLFLFAGALFLGIDRVLPAPFAPESVESPSVGIAASPESVL